MRQPSSPRPGPGRLDGAIAAYFQAQDRGRPLTREELLGQYPDLAEELREFFDGRTTPERPAGPVASAEAVDGNFLPAPATPAGPATAAPAGGPTSPADPTPPAFGDYELLGEIARGGMGVVCKARQRSLNRVVALKMIRAGQLASEQDVARFRLEAEAAAQLEHPNIVPVYETGEHQGQHFFSMKLVSGGSLAGAVGRLRHQPRETARLLARVARAVHHAHQRGLLHRDLKPANVLLDEQGEPVVTDFGLARRVGGDAGMTQSGAIVGTPSYMPPEQALGKKRLTTAADVYALGAILYECLTGRPPFREATPLETVLAVVEREPEPPRSVEPAADRDLEQICLKCLRRDPEQRYPTAAALAEDLERWLEGKPVAARPLSPWGRGWRWGRRQPVVAAAVIAALVYMVGVFVGFGPLQGQPFVVLGTAGFFCFLILFPAAYSGLRNSNRVMRQLERLTAATEGASRQPAPAAPPAAGTEVTAVARWDVLLGMLHGGWYGLVIALTAMLAMHLVLDRSVLPELVAVLRAALEGSAVGALAGGLTGLYWGARARPGGIVAWTLLFPLIVFGGLVGPFLVPEITRVWVLPLMLFLPLFPALQSAAARAWPPRGAKAQAASRYMEVVSGEAYGRVSVYSAWMGVLLAGCVVGMEVGFAVGAVVGQTLGALLGTVVFWLATVALGWWPRRQPGEGAGRPLWRPAVLAALGGIAFLWLYRGPLQGDDMAVVLAPRAVQPVAVRDVLLSPDARWLVSRDQKGGVCLWEVKTGKCRTLNAKASNMTLSADGGALLLGAGQEVAAYDLADLAEGREKPDRALQVAPAERLTATRGLGLAVVAGRKDRLLRVRDGGWLYLWNLAPPRTNPTTWEAPGGELFALAATEELALSGGMDGTIRLWNLPEGTAAGRLVGHRAWVAALAVTPDGRRAVSSGYDRTVRVWDLPGRRLQRTLRGHGERGACAVAISSDGRLAASGGWDGTVRLWRLEE